MKKFLIVLALTVKIGILAAQEPLSIPTKNHCSFSGTAWEDELYTFDKSLEVQKWINEIVENGGATQNFTALQASVENVAAIFDPATGKRYLLYSMDFIEKAKGTLAVYGALAHEIGHHVNHHQLTESRRAMEELEADQFMGYVLAKTEGIGSLSDAQKIVDILPASPPSVNDAQNSENRRESIKKGWEAATISLTIKSAGFDNDPQKAKFLESEFKILPCCSPLELPKTPFASAKTLGDIAQKLAVTLDKQGYYYRSFKSYKGGFALIVQMEQFNADYTFRNDQARWVAMPMGGSFLGVMDYFKNLLLPQKSNFRTFVFVVTAQSFTTSEGNNVTKSEAEAWYKTGFNKLPPSIAATPITEGVSVTALVYEFQVPEATRKAKQNCPSIDTKRHLVQSKIWDSF